MKFLAAIALAFVLLASPLLCAAMPCDFGAPSHDCCPNAPVKNAIACPYDLMDHAKAAHAPLAAPVPILATIELCPAPAIIAVDGQRVDPDLRDLHTRIRVLRL
jgi:hypothetical protein